MEPDEVIGYYDEEDGDVGAFPFPFALRRAVRAMPVRRSVARPVYRAPQKARTYGRRIIATTERRRYFGLGTVSLAAGGTGQLAQVCQGPIQGERLILTTPATAGEVTVTNVRVGTQSQLEGTAAMPVEMFAPDATGSALQLDPAQTGVTITIDLANSGAGANTVAGGLIGVTGR